MRDFQTQPCCWCDTPVRWDAPRLGSMCEDCYAIERTISQGCELWRKNRADAIMARLIDITSTFTVYESREVASALDRLQVMVTARHFAMILKQHQSEER